MSVERSRENGPWNRCNRRRLSRRADGLRRGTHGGFSAPGDLAGLQVEGVKPATFFRVHHKAKSAWRLFVRDAAKIHVGNCDVNIVRVRSRAPLAAAELAALTDSGLPQNFAAMIGIDCMHHPRLLSDYQRSPSTIELHKDRRLTEIVIRAVMFGAIRFHGSG